ncbi:MAG: hypothetical protein K2X38_05800 [Gemmataceae bacterium]|nr:hypothetical protein [Gemmataceae bacterium]
MTAATTDTLDRLAMDCLVHFKEEAALLREANVVATGLDDALNGGQADEWRQLLAKAQSLPGQLESLRPRRARIRLRLQTTLGGTIHDASIRRLVERLSPELGEPLLQVRADLAEAWDTLAKLQFRQTAFVRICGDFIRRIIADGAGATPVGPRYGPHGRPVAATIGAVFAAKG